VLDPPIAPTLRRAIFIFSTISNIISAVTTTKDDEAVKTAVNSWLSEQAASFYEEDIQNLVISINDIDSDSSARLRWPSGKVSDEGFQVRNTIAMKIRQILGILDVKSYVGIKCPPADVLRKFGEGVKAQVPSSSSESSSKL
ncbi:hypothetical protein AVEN_18994-1, partial [Araneus ventricosus]